MSEESSGPAASPPVAAAPEVRVVVCTDSRPNRRSGRSKFEAPRTAHHEGDKTQGKRFEEKGSSARDAEDVSDDKANHHCGRRRINSVVQMEDGRDEGDKEDTDDQEGNDRFQQRVTTSGVNQDEADGEDLPFPGFAPKTFMFFTQRNWLRFSCLRLITWPYFERMSMAVILLNCITLGMYQPCVDEVCDTTRCKVLAGFDHFIFAFFTAEMIIKMIAMGVFGKDTYMADTWNRLDCFIVVAGSVEYAVDTENLSISAIRTIRVLRPLRAINRIPSMRILVMLLLDTLPMLGNVLLLCFFVFFIFGIIGVQLWAGVLRHRCFLDLNASYSIPESMKVNRYYQPPLVDYICSHPSDGGMLKCENLPEFEYEGIRCNGTAQMYTNNTPTNDSCVNWNQYYTSCIPEATNPFKGAVSFDNIGLAWVVIFQVISLESWVNIMYYIQDAHSFWDWIYFVALIVIGSFFMINLCLVVIATQFSETKKRETERMLQERKRFQSCSTLASNSEPGGCYSELLKLLVQLWRQAKRKIIRGYRRTRGKKRQKINPEKSISLRRKRTKKKGTVQTIYIHPPPHQHYLHHHHHHHYHLNIVSPDRYPSRADSSPTAPRASPEASDVDPISSPRRPNFLMLPGNSYSLNPSSESLNTLALGAVEVFSPALFKSQQSTPNHLAALLPLTRTPSFNSSVTGRALASLPEVLAAHGAKNAALAASNMLLNSDTEPNKLQSVADKGLFADNLLMDIVADKQLSTQFSMQSECDTHLSHSEHEEESEKDRNESDSEGDEEEERESSRMRSPSNICAVMKQFQMLLKKFVESNIIHRSILVAILLNTLSMGVEHHLQPDWLTKTLEYSNVVFSVLFATEMGFKVMAYGPFGYISDGFNLFDGFIVILSVVELAQGGASGLSVLRTFRLLRILKLVRFMPALRRQLVVMLRTMDNVATFFALLVLFMFIFSILGMSVFGGRFCEHPDGTSCSCEERSNATSDCLCDRANFDTLLWSLVTVFQVLTQEDWNTVLYNGMAHTSNWASLYFIALMTFGNYVLFNLLVAILVEGFSTEDEEKKREKQKEQEEIEKQEKEKERLRLAENNNIELHKDQDKISSSEPDLKNNKEKEKKMLAVPAPVSVTAIKENTVQPYSETLASDGPVNPPIITHTAATPMGTPMATPQGSPNESALKDSNKLAVSVNRTLNRSSLSVESDKTSTNLYHRGSPRPSPRLHRSSSRGSQRSITWRQKNTRRNGDKTSLVVDSLSDSADDADDDVLSSSQNSQSGTYSPGIPRSAGAGNTSCVTYFFSTDCNGHPPLNNQRTLSPQNSIKGQRVLTPKNSIKSNYSWSRNNSVSSNRSVCNSFELSRQNSFTSHRTVNSLGSGTSKDDHKPKNLLDMPEIKLALDRGEDDDAKEEDDPDAIDETDWNCSWCPEPKGCFARRHEYSLYILHPDHCLRRLCHHLISRRWFDNSVLFFIALNCITLAMERPNIPPDSIEREFLTYANYVFTVIFSFEMMIKVLSKGLLIGKHAYLKSGWNVMDGFLVIISLVDVLISITADSSPRIFGILRVFRLLRTLRPLRVISRAPGLKLVVQTLLSSLRPIGNIVLICCTFFIIFGILGVQLFKGTFYYCKGPNVQHVINKSQCQADKQNVWTNHKYNFDNLGMALMALFVLASKDGWVQIMYTGLDAVGIDQQPQENFSEWRLLYFISFLLLVGFFVLNMFVGVVVENFHKCRESQEKEERAMRAAKRQEKLEKKRKKLRVPPYWSVYSRPRLLIHTIISSKYFDLAIAGVIGLNVITMAMEYYMMPPELEFALMIFNYFFTSVFILEAAMKIVALGFFRYIKDRWNQLDIMIVILSIIGIILEEMRTNVIPINPTIIRVMRVVRIARVLKLLKMAKGIRALLDTVIQALPQVGNLGLLFFLLFFIFAALGVELFGRLDCSALHPCVGLSQHAHFKNFGMAFLTLFRVATGDNWNGIMKDTLREDCDRSDNCLNNCCVSPLIAPVYFVVFVLMAQFVLVNVVVAVLMKHLEETYKYKELDDEVEEELRKEMATLALDKQQENIELKEAHRVMDDDGTSAPGEENYSIDKLEEDATVDSIPKVVADDLDEMSQGTGDDDTDCLAGSISNQPPSFTFSVRPPSEEQSHHSEDNSSFSPARIAITMETLSTPSNTMLSPGMLTPSSLSQTSLSSASLAPPSPVSPSLSEPGIRITSPPLSPVQHSPKLMHLRVQGQSGMRHPLLKQYSMDMGSDSQIHHGSVPNVWEKVKEESVPKPDLKKPKNIQGISQSQPSLAFPKPDSLESEPDRKTPRQRLKQRLLRSKSSGAKYSRFRDKYKHEKCGEAAQPMMDKNIARSKEKLRNSQCGSGETGSDLEDSLISNWADEEAACDEEVKMITGEAGDEEDDIKPTLGACISSDLEDRTNTSFSLSNVVDSLNSSLDYDLLSHSNAHPAGEMTNNHTCHEAPRSSVSRSRGPTPRGGSLRKKARKHLTDPGIDNSSFELGEDVQTPTCDSAGSGSHRMASNNTATPVLAASTSRTGASPHFVYPSGPCGTYPSPSLPQQLLTAATGGMHGSPPLALQSFQASITPSPISGMLQQQPRSLGLSGGVLLSPRSIPGVSQERLTTSSSSPPHHAYSTSPNPASPHQHRLSMDCNSSSLSASSPSYPLLSASPAAQLPSHHHQPHSFTGPLEAASSSLLLPLPTSSTSAQPLINLNMGSSLQPLHSREGLLPLVVTHPLQTSPIPAASPNSGPLPSMQTSSFSGSGASTDNPINQHRTLPNCQLTDPDVSDSSGHL
ncbi:voltage-dependent T-type calcium channel subunit alpha-1G-like isoform X7 [Pomacea canaliculata]|uniref:voltage-dependent T-type calcium channel subunit alpha-1G-like isoform X7 n=1 Tax=Pomacea canaliculata TaxID=400727 RepID=UPI000D735E7D|nr:voltage-dependent T-type calcium channel subunit alpha-1G-like isoform X7 [Pomacea canaliculata]